MLIDALRARLGDPSAPSFRLMGEDLQALTLDEVRRALDAQYAAIPYALRETLVAEERDLAEESHRWLRRYNRSMHGRVAGYLELGRRCEFRYPWPVVAILGIVQVMSGMDRARLYGLAGRVASRVGYKFADAPVGLNRFAVLRALRTRWPLRGLPDNLEQLGDASEDILRRTNRGIFADSVPTVLRALRADALRTAGQRDVADALLDGRAALLWDDECARLARAIADGLAIPDEGARFTALAATTLRHFDREQAIFTHHISSRSKRRKLPAAKSVPAPVVERGKLVFKAFALPAAFDMRDHDVRVDAFGRAFVTSITGSLADYGVARTWVERRFSSLADRRE